MRQISLRACGVAVVAILALQPQGAAMQSPPAPLDVAAFFSGAQRVVQDTNADGIADAVAARIIVPDSPSKEDSLVAANLAGRLGFETSALSLPLVLRQREVTEPTSIQVPILVGRTNRFVMALIEKGEIDLSVLQPGQALVAVVRSPLGGGPGLVVAGADDEGTLAAGIEVAARLPRLWGMTGITLTGIADQVSGHLRRAGVATRQSAVRALVVDRERRGLASVTVQAFVSAGQTPRAVKAFEDLERAHRRGLEPQTLNYSDVAQTTVELIVDGAVAAKAAVARSGLNSRTLTPPIDPNDLAPGSPGDRGRPAEAGGGGGKTFDLTNPYTIEGWYADDYTDLIPDRTEASIVIGGAADALGASHIAARLGLETTGVTLPIAKMDSDVHDPQREGPSILVGRDNKFVKDLEKIGRTHFTGLEPGDGVVQVVPNAFGNVTATVVAGADPAGTEAASQYLARRVPYVWDNTRGALSFSDVRTEVGRFLGGKSAAGQASQALRELDAVLADVKGKKLTSFDATLFIETAEPTLDTFLAEHARATLGDAKVTVTSKAMTAPAPVIEETIDVPWEVDEFRDRFRKEVLPKVTPGASVDLELRLSEAPEFRQTLTREIEAELSKAGATAPRVWVRSAYKQGFMWITEEVIPALKGKGARSLRVKVAEHKPDLSKDQKFYMVPSRWLHELYPVDEIVQRELGINREQFTLELVDSPADIYTVEGLDGAGRVVHTATFSPKFVTREYIDKFPGWSQVEVTTGWLTATVNGTQVADSRIQTDPERFWDHYQSKVLPRIYDHVMKVTDNKPMPDKQPFFRDLDIDVWMSEPDFRIGVDEELVSSLESLHEDLYFVTLDFFDALGRTTTKHRLAGPGKICPIIHPERRGQPGQVKVLYAGNTSTKAAIEIRYSEEGARAPERVNRDLGQIDTTAPVALRSVVRADRVREIELQVEAKDDQQAARAADALDALTRLHGAGLFRTTLSLDHVDRVAVNVALKDASTRRTIANTGTAAPSSALAPGARPSLPLVTWDHVIGPDESEALVAKLAAFPEVRAYKAGRSYRGRDISVLELTEPTPSEIVSLAKLTVLKPTVFITGRQHANEVSSTSHILKLAELVVSDPAYRSLLKKVNIVLHPVENPDGAQMAYDLQKLTPSHMLHAGRYSALGMDVASQVNVANPLLPEALVRGRLWREWLPDIYLNPHGYPSHEWVQQFAGYVPPGFRSYWTTRGWYTSVGGLRDPRYPEHADAIAALRESIVREINSNADVKAMNLRHQARYRRWAYGFSPYVYNQEIYKDTAIYYTDPETGEVRGSRRAGTSRGGGGRFAIGSWPQVTFVSGGTESPDETAQGDWLNLVTKPGFSYLMAHLTYLRDGQYAVERIEESGQRDSASITLLRVRPVRPVAPTERR